MSSISSEMTYVTTKIGVRCDHWSHIDQRTKRSLKNITILIVNNFHLLATILISFGTP